MRLSSRFVRGHKQRPATPARKKSARPKSDPTRDGSVFAPPNADSRNLYLIGEVNENSCADVISGLISLSEKTPHEPIRLFLSTMGGDVDEALAIYDAIQMIPSPVYTIGLGKVMSAGCLLLASGEKGHRFLGANANMMYHAIEFDNIGDVASHLNYLNECERIAKAYDLLISKLTGRTLKAVESLYKPERIDKYLTAKEAIKFGFADRVTFKYCLSEVK